MILEGLKKWLLQNHINKHLKLKPSEVNKKKIKTIFVLHTVEDISKNDIVRSIVEILGISSNHVQVLSFTNDKKLQQSKKDVLLDLNGISWNFKRYLGNLDTILQTPFDMLLNLSEENSILLNAITAASKADFKVGISRYDERLFHLIIKTKIKDINIFSTELKKYLITLNKL